MSGLESCQKGSAGMPECQAAHYGYLIVAPMILFLGTVGNTWNIVVATRYSLRRSPTACFLVALAATDTLTIWTGLGRHFALSLTGVDVRNISPIACKTQRFLLYVAMDTSAYILVAITAERFVAVCLPNFRSWLSLRRSLITVFALAMASILFNLHVPWTRGEEIIVNREKNTTTILTCGYPKPEFRKYWIQYQGWVAMAYFCIVPFAAMIIMNGLIIKKLRAIQRTPVGKLKGRSHRSLTLMLLCGSVVFLFITVPAVLYNTIEATMDKSRLDNAAKQRLKTVDAYITLLQYLNNAINFYVYFLTGKGFRRDVITAFRKCARLKRNLISQEELRENVTKSSTSNSIKS